MNDLLDWLGRLSVGALAVAGLALLVLAALAMVASATLSIALAAAALALWLVAAAAFAAAATSGRKARDRSLAAGIPIAIALCFALVAARSAGQATGIMPSSGGSGVEGVAGATQNAPPTPGGPATPSASPTDTSSPEPSPEPSPTLHHGRVAIASLHITTPVARGDSATVTVTSDPWVPCSIRVGYRGASAASGLSSTIADGSGNASWSWTVAADAPTGTWPVRVTCANGGWAAWDTVTLRIR